jgi:hypothetical protein
MDGTISTGETESFYCKSLLEGLDGTGFPSSAFTRGKSVKSIGGSIREESRDWGPADPGRRGSAAFPDRYA